MEGEFFARERLRGERFGLVGAGWARSRFGRGGGRFGGRCLLVAVAVAHPEHPEMLMVFSWGEDYGENRTVLLERCGYCD